MEINSFQSMKFIQKSGNDEQFVQLENDIDNGGDELMETLLIGEDEEAFGSSERHRELGSKVVNADAGVDEHSLIDMRADD